MSVVLTDFGVFRGLKFRATVKWICLLVGSLGGVASTIIHFTQKNKMGTETQVTKIPPTTTVKSATSIDIPSDKKDTLSDSDDNNTDDGGLNSINSGKPPKY